jgi:hypothetical protein
MDRLCWDPRDTGEPPLVEGLKNQDKVLAMVGKVGDQACRDVATFLEQCAQRIEPHLKSVAIARRYGRGPAQTWDLQWQVYPKNCPDWRPFYLGVYVGTQPPAVGAWIWTRGGRRAEDELVKILGRRVNARSNDWQQSPGHVALAQVEVRLLKKLGNLDVEQEPLIAQVCRALTFEPSDVKSIAAITNRAAE